ncbi:MAG: hypothetical protein NTX32_06020 [Candidatus Firestonebacteria bacterium]|nr:hypothetical protein [Candidatus Firestonebacteria bacterium]
MNTIAARKDASSVSLKDFAKINMEQAASTKFAKIKILIAAAKGKKRKNTFKG